ncbi:uncharacterized protein A4U43_C08F8340 [Asparagus officinalis]|nr:uncharacterized protein A4U43_C08F8340 [Asparagus officinalis]
MCRDPLAQNSNQNAANFSFPLFSSSTAASPPPSATKTPSGGDDRLPHLTSLRRLSLSSPSARLPQTLTLALTPHLPSLSPPSSTASSSSSGTTPPAPSSSSAPPPPPPPPSLPLLVDLAADLAARSRDRKTTCPNPQPPPSAQPTSNPPNLLHPRRALRLPGQARSRRQILPQPPPSRLQSGPDHPQHAS